MKAKDIDSYLTFDFKSDDEIANFDEKQMAAYEHSLKVYRDLWGVMDTQFEKGRDSKAVEIAALMKNAGESSDKISTFTGLTVEEIDAL